MGTRSERASADERGREEEEAPPLVAILTEVCRLLVECVNQHVALLHLLIRMLESFFSRRNHSNAKASRRKDSAALRILGGAARGRTLLISGHNSICNYKCRQRRQRRRQRRQWDPPRGGQTTTRGGHGGCSARRRPRAAASFWPFSY